MSFGLGFVTLFISLIWRLFGTYGEFGGKGATVHDVPCRYKTIRTRYGITYLRIALITIKIIAVNSGMKQDCIDSLNKLV
jgi:hypothetical protein